MKIKTKLWIAFGALSGVVVVTAGSAWRTASAIERQAAAMVQVHGAARSAAEATRLATEVTRGDSDEFVANPNEARAVQAKKSAESIGAHLAEIAGLPVDPAMASRINRAKEDHARMTESLAASEKALRERGFSPEEGAQGTLRKAVHDLEKAATERNEPEVTVLVLQCRRHEKDFMLRRDVKYKAELEKVAAALTAKIDKLDIPAETKKTFGTLLTQYTSGFATLVASYEKVAAADTLFQAASKAIDESINDVCSMASANIDHEQASLLGALATQRLMLMVLGAGGLGLAAFFSFATTRSILSPLAGLTASLNELNSGDGDLTRRVPADRKDEIGELATKFNGFIGHVHGLVSQVSQASHQVAAAAQQIASSSEEMSRGLTQQNSQSGQVAAASAELSSSVAGIATSASETAREAQQSGRDAEQGGELVASVVHDIDNVRTTVQSAVEIIEGLGAKSDEIRQIVSVINDIADQTNLLALNAAIEAARAGDHGRGFAVVADEVRKLAERTTASTGQVASTVQGIQEQTDRAVAQIREGSSRVNATAEHAAKAGEGIKQAVARSGRVSELVASIAKSGDQQSAATEEISRSIEEMAQVSREVSAGAEQAASAASTLSQQSESLRTLVSRFKV